MFISEFIKKKKLGQILVEQGLASEDDIVRCLDIQQQTKEFLGNILVKECIITETQLFKILCIQKEMKFCEPDEAEKLVNQVKLDDFKLLDQQFATQHTVVICGIDDIANKITFLITNPIDEDLKESLRKMFVDRNVDFYSATRETVKKFHARYSTVKVEELKDIYRNALQTNNVDAVLKTCHQAAQKRQFALLHQLLKNHHNADIRRSIILMCRNINNDAKILKVLNEAFQKESDDNVKKTILFVAKSIKERSLQML